MSGHHPFSELAKDFTSERRLRVGGTKLDAVVLRRAPRRSRCPGVMVVGAAHPSSPLGEPDLVTHLLNSLGLYHLKNVVVAPTKPPPRKTSKIRSTRSEMSHTPSSPLPSPVKTKTRPTAQPKATTIRKRRGLFITVAPRTGPRRPLRRRPHIVDRANSFGADGLARERRICGAFSVT